MQAVDGKWSGFVMFVCHIISARRDLFLLALVRLEVRVIITASAPL